MSIDADRGPTVSVQLGGTSAQSAADTHLVDGILVAPDRVLVPSLSASQEGELRAAHVLVAAAGGHERYDIARAEILDGARAGEGVGLLYLAAPAPDPDGAPPWIDNHGLAEQLGSLTAAPEPAGGLAGVPADDSPRPPVPVIHFPWGGIDVVAWSICAFVPWCIVAPPPGPPPGPPPDPRA